MRLPIHNFYIVLMFLNWRLEEKHSSYALKFMFNYCKTLEYTLCDCIQVLKCSKYFWNKKLYPRNLEKTTFCVDMIKSNYKKILLSSIIPIHYFFNCNLESVRSNNSYQCVTLGRFYWTAIANVFGFNITQIMSIL